MPLPVIPIEPPYLPELLPEVVEYVEEILPEGSRVFEFGSGESTLWWAGWCTVVSVEHEPLWFDEVERAIRESGRYRANLILVADHDAIAHAIDGFGMFNAVFVDCYSPARKEAIRRSVAHVKPGGYLIVDDSHWGGVAAAIKETVAGDTWDCTVFGGLHTRKTGAVRHHQTSIYRRPKDG